MSDAPIIVDTGDNPQHCVLWLHGLGADGHDFEPIVPELLRPGWPALRFIFPHAPVRPVTINGGMAMRAWYDLYGADLAALEDSDGLRNSIRFVHHCFDAERERGIAANKLMLAGFSQGGAIALAAGLRYPHALGGVIALSTYLPLREQFAAEAHSANLKTPIFMGHGNMDAVVPQRLGELSRDRLRELGYDIRWTSYSGMGHSVVQSEIKDIARFLGSWLQG